ncbi:MAG: hypothetical protein GY799_21680 [Desulfobulbaceae bacterium]|nr:hypothetical protein [Desulfobulbaceae bacterium]
MKKIKTIFGQRPHYYNSQLLLEDDFLEEQRYHVNARRMHNQKLHGKGVVEGLTISREHGQSISINGGVAIDEAGNEILIETIKGVSLAEFGANESVRVVLIYEEENEYETSSHQKNRCQYFASIILSKDSASGTGVTLALLHLDNQGNLLEEAIDYKKTSYVQRLVAGAIKAENLDDSLRRGWVRMPFRPIPLTNPLKGDQEAPPPFRIGATESRSADQENPNDPAGAAGTMAIPIPPSVTQVTALRIAGEKNEGEIQIELLKGGWDPKENKHLRQKIVDEIVSEEPYLRTFPIKDMNLDAEYQTLSLWIRGTGKTSISLIAVEFVY